VFESGVSDPRSRPESCRQAPDVEGWFARRTWAAPPWESGDLASVKAGRTVSVVLPALDEEDTVGGVVAAVAPLTVGATPLVDELVVLDSGSTDATAGRARAAGAREEALPEVPVRSGKGEVLWRSLAATSGDLVVFLDADLVDVGGTVARCVVALLGPLLTVDGVEMVKGFYHRPLHLPHDGAAESDATLTGGGGVTEPAARPVLTSLRPELTGVIQPLGGEYAGTRALLESVPFATGHGVEIGLLLDTHTTRGLDAIAQVDLGVPEHRHRSSRVFGSTAAEVLDTALRRCVDRDNGSTDGLTQFVTVDGDRVSDEHPIAVTDRPSMREFALTGDRGRVESCPKGMVYGPCGGVREGGGCELDAARPCPWTVRAGPVGLRTWPAAARARPRSAGATPALEEAAPIVLADLSVPSFDLPALRAGTGVLAPVSDAVLVGDHHDRPTYPATMVASEILGAGGRPWITLTCRDRNRVVLEQDIAGLAALGVEGVLCVTGDARGRDVRSGVTQVFDLDSTRLAHLASSAGLRAAVAVAPAAPPSGLRARALAEKQRAGASLAVINHVSAPEDLNEFLAEARSVGADLPAIAGVAVYTDEPSARILQAFPGLSLDEETVAGVLASRDPVAAGIDAAVAEAVALLAVPGVVGVNLSGRASSTGWEAAAEVHAEVALRVRRECAVRGRRGPASGERRPCRGGG
jgi:glucosyl-3-phosphoglycerate synthase